MAREDQVLAVQGHLLVQVVKQRWLELYQESVDLVHIQSKVLPRLVALPPRSAVVSDDREKERQGRAVGPGSWGGKPRERPRGDLPAV